MSIILATCRWRSEESPTWWELDPISTKKQSTMAYFFDSSYIGGVGRKIAV
jgi:hypothetical protein